MAPLLNSWLRPRCKLRAPATRQGCCCRLHVEELESRLAPSASAVSPNVAITTDPGVQQMPSIAADPLDSKHEVIAYLDYSLLKTGYAGIGVAVSNDGGTTWQHTSIPLPANIAQGAATPIVQFDGQGHVFVSFAAATFLGPLPPITDPDGGPQRALGFQSNNGIFVARSDDGGMIWDTPVPVVSNLYDGQHPVNFEIKPDLAIDTFRTLPDGQPNPNYGSLYEVWSRYYAPGLFPGEPTSTGSSDIMFAVSRDGGQSWQLQLQQEPGSHVPQTVIYDPTNFGTGIPAGLGFVNWSHVAVGAAGDIYVSLYLGGSFAVYHSTDGGNTFVAPDFSGTLGLPFGPSGNTLPGSSNNLPLDYFRQQPVRAIATDPAQPGLVFAAEAVGPVYASGNAIDPGEINFARSSDQGQTWQTTVQMGGQTASVLNDDNNGQIAQGLPGDVLSAMALPKMAVDAQGDIVLIWYDTRRDPANPANPANHLLDVFATVSTDGGQTFSPNFRLTTVSFDPNAGAFTDATGNTDYYLGDSLGLTVADGTAYATWTDTRNGNQNIEFASFPINPPPPPPSNRFAPNNTAAMATNFGLVVTRAVPKLTLAAGNEEWFQLQAAATGTLTVVATSIGQVGLAANTLQLQLYDATGNNLLASGTDLQNAAGDLIGQSVAYPSNTGQVFLVRVFRTNSTNTNPTLYDLALQSLTADLGTQAFVGGVTGTLAAAGGQALYQLTAPASGSLQVQFTNGANVNGNLNLQVLDANTLAVLSNPQPLVITPTGPNESIPKATATGLVGPGSVQVAGDIGNGPFGTTTGDYNFYRLAAAAGQRIEATLADPQGSTLDGVIVLYDSAGNLLQLVDNKGPGVGEFLSYVTNKTDTYYVVIYGSTSNDAPPTDPFTPGTGGGLPSNPGAYDLTITVQAVGPGAVQQYAVLVQQGQTVLLLVSGEGPSTGDFALNVVNLDQFATPQNTSLLFPAGQGPSQEAVADLTGNGRMDIVVSNTQTNTVSVLLNNGDGTFQAPRQYAVGAYTTPVVSQGFAPNLGRAVAVADLTGNGIPDIIVTNYASGDVSVLMGRGDGTFEPQRRFDATAGAFAMAVGDLTGNGILDLVVVGSTASNGKIAVLLGRGDGTFEPPLLSDSPLTDPNPFVSVQLADLNKDGRLDLLLASVTDPNIHVLFGNGDGTFRAGPNIPGPASALAVADLNKDGIPDVVEASLTKTVSYELGLGDGTFQKGQQYPSGQDVFAVTVADFGSAVMQADGTVTLGPPDGIPDLLVAASGVSQSALSGPPQILFYPGLVDAQGNFAGFGTAIVLASPPTPIDIKVADFTGDGSPDIAVVEQDGARIIFSKPPNIPPNTTPQTARNLGTVVHVVEAAQTIVPGHEDSYFTVIAPTEAAQGAGDETLDFSALFEAQGGAGLAMEVRNAQGNLLATGERFRVVVPQGAVLTLHIFGVAGGTGAYTLDIDALPQLVSVQAEALLTGGPTASLVLTFQGDRLDAASAEVPNNYTVTWLGPNGNQVIPVQAAVYDPGANIDVATGITYPTAIRQTITLVFAQPLPAGSYEVALSSAIQAAPFSAGEDSLLAPAAPRSGITGHELVAALGGTITEGVDLTLASLVPAGAALNSASAFNFKDGTPFLTQLHDDLGALLDAGLTRLGDNVTIPATIDQQILERFNPALGPAGQRPVSVLIIWLDPVAISLVSLRNQQRADYNLRDNQLLNTFLNAFVSVAGNVEVCVLPFVPTVAQSFLLSVDSASATVRGGAVYLGADSQQVVPLTADLRAGTTSFLFNFASTALAAPPADAGRRSQQANTTSDPTASPLAALLSLDTRSQTAAVTPIIPLLRLDATSVPAGPETLVAFVAALGGDSGRQLALTRSTDTGAPSWTEAVVTSVQSLLAEVSVAFRGFIAPIRALLGAVLGKLQMKARRADPDQMPLLRLQVEATLQQDEEAAQEPLREDSRQQTDFTPALAVVVAGIWQSGGCAASAADRRARKARRMQKPSLNRTR